MKKKLFAAMVAAMALSSSLTAFAAPETMKDGTVFDADYYAQQNHDVVAVFGTGKDALYHHYTTYGKAEGRMSHMNDVAHMISADGAAFDASFYAQQNPDVVAAFGTDAEALYGHYTRHGKAEGRQGHMNEASHLTNTNTHDTANRHQ